MGVCEGLLALLDSEPRCGNQLKTAFETATGDVWALNIGEVYASLDRLARDGLVDVGLQDEADRRTYTITEDGHSELARWLGATLAGAPLPRDDLLLKVLLSLGAPSVDAREVIQDQRTAIIEVLQAHRRELRADARAGDELVARLVIDAPVLRLEAELRWLDLCEERLIAHTRPRSTRRTPR
jgi:DNA-binding PadR family transcriptional regulator